LDSNNLNSKLLPLVSIVITTKNEEKNIRHCLESIKLQTWLNKEIIVVDNSSTDNTHAIAKEYTEKVFIKGPERSAQRNYGMIEKACGDFVIYIDADMILSPTLIEACVSHTQATGAVALHIPEIILGKNYFSRVRRFERSFYDGTPIDGARFFERSSFVQVGGFDESVFVVGSGEDWDIDKLIKQVGRIELLPQLGSIMYKQIWIMREFVEKRGVLWSKHFAEIYHNEAEFTLIPYLSKKSYYSLGFDGYIKKWGRYDPDIQCQFGIKYRFWTVFTCEGKWRRLVERLDLSVGMYFLRICVGVVFMLKKCGIARTVPSSR